MRYLVTGQRSLSYDQTNRPNLEKDYSLKHIQERGAYLLHSAGRFLDDVTSTNTTDKAVSRPNKKNKTETIK
jgi:hypothetical protein